MANKYLTPSMALAIGAPAPALLSIGVNMSHAIVNPAPAPAPALLTMSVIRKSLPDYFGRDAVSDAQALIDRAQKYAPLCATLAGYAVERAQSGNANGLTKFDAWAKSLKHAQGAKIRALCAHVLGVKPAHLKSAEISDYENFAQACEVELLALVAPAPAKPRAEPTNWKQLFEALKAEHEALQAEHEALRAQHEALRAVTKAQDMKTLDAMTAKA